MTNWYLPALIAMLLFGIHNIFVQASARTSIGDAAGAFVMEGAAALLLGVFLLASGGAFSAATWNQRGAVMAAIAGACIFGGVIFYFRAFSAGGKLSLAAPLVFGGSIAIPALFGILVLKEPLSFRHGTGIVFSLAAMWLLR